MVCGTVFKNGDMLLVNYSIFIKDSGELVDTTDENVAKLHKKFEEGRIYEPELAIIGEGRFIKGFEEALSKIEELGKVYEVEVPPEKGYGERDPNKVRVLPTRAFIKSNITPEVGKEVTINNMVGRIISVSGGRVTVDFNHPLAGKTLLIKFTVVKKLDDLIEKVKYLVKRRVRRASLESIKVSYKESSNSVEIELPKEFRLDENIQIAKYLISRDISRWINQIKEVVFIDRFEASEFKLGESVEQRKETA